MRIIDKNTDFYDYLQYMYKDNTFTFDRTDSFFVTKEMMCEYLRIVSPSDARLGWYTFLKLQVCNTFWLFLIEITEVDKYRVPTNYKIHYLSNWKNYSKIRKLISLDFIDFNWNFYSFLLKKENRYFRKRDNDNEKEINLVKKYSSELMSEIDNNDYVLKLSINRYVRYRDDHSEIIKHLPLLKATGLADLIEPLEIYLAFEEYFSLEKTSTERTTSKDITDKEKIENHGFDYKFSFRGNNKS